MADKQQNDSKYKCIEGDNNDWELIRCCRTEKDKYFPLLIKRHYVLVVNIGYRFFLDRGTAEDVAQEVFLTLYNELDRLQEGKQPFVHWLCRITSNSCRTLYRKRNSERNAVALGRLDHWYGEAVSGAGSEYNDEKSTAIRYVNEALQTLKPDERMALVLSYIAELKTRDIALAMKAPEYTIRRLLRRAEEKLRKSIIQLKLEDHA